MNREELRATFTIRRVLAFLLTSAAVLLLLTQVSIDRERAMAMTAARIATDQVVPSLVQGWRDRTDTPQTGPIRVSMHWEGVDSIQAELAQACQGHFLVQPPRPGIPRLEFAIETQENHLTLVGSLPSADLSASGVRRIGDWRSLVPPLFAILMALFFRRLLFAMIGAIVVGALLHFRGNPISNLWQGAQSYVWGVLSDVFHLEILAFTFALVGMVMVATRSGGSQGLIDLVGRIAGSARSTRIATFLMGIVIFFDDYANTIVVGTTARPMSDRWRISREKLAYLVDSTAAPVAGLAIISTWIAFELGLLQPLIDQLHLQLEPGLPTSAYSMFIAMLPFRFYCLTTLMFVFTGAVTSRDYGSMLKAERRAAETGQVLSAQARPLTSRTIADVTPEPGNPFRWYNAVVPILVVVLAVLVGMLYSGRGVVAETAGEFDLASLETWKLAFGAADSGLVLLVAALIGSGVAILMSVSQRLLKPHVAFITWIKGVPAMLLAVSILICAWAIQIVCDDLGTSVFLVSAIGESIPSLLFPIFVFLLAAGTAFATGTSWGTMGILLPVIVPWAYTVSQGPGGSMGVVLLSAAAVLDGAIMGDHCSPISDTTVMSSIASSCDHIDHVRTQIPYAITCMILAALAYLAIGAGMPSWITYLALIAGILVVFFAVGRSIARSG